MPNPKSQNLRIFLCHASEDKPKVRPLYQRLNSDGYDVWFDEQSMIPGHDWKLEIYKGIRNADVIIICISSISANRQHIADTLATLKS